MLSKRIFDLLFAIPGIVLLLPFFCIIAFLVRMDSEGGVIFTQRRVGLNGRHFLILKFRTMVVNAESMGPKVTPSDDSRITGIGCFLRRYKLDELPQLFNVLKGEMSLVGPRPELPEYVDFYPQEAKEIILSVLPGMTDNAFIEFRREDQILMNSVDLVKDYREKILPIKLGYYERYANERSLWVDLNLIVRTFSTILKQT